MKRTFRSIAFYLAMIAVIVAIYSFTSGTGKRNKKAYIRTLS